MQLQLAEWFSTFNTLLVPLCPENSWLALTAVGLEKGEFDKLFMLQM